MPTYFVNVPAVSCLTRWPIQMVNYFVTPMCSSNVSFHLHVSLFLLSLSNYHIFCNPIMHHRWTLFDAPAKLQTWHTFAHSNFPSPVFSIHNTIIPTFIRWLRIYVGMNRVISLMQFFNKPLETISKYLMHEKEKYPSHFIMNEYQFTISNGC